LQEDEEFVPEELGGDVKGDVEGAGEAELEGEGGGVVEEATEEDEE
jgi:hypothetical protein